MKQRLLSGDIKAWVRILIPIGVVIALFVWKTFLTPDMLFIILLSVFSVYGLAFEFVKMFAPFLGLLVSYDALRGLVPFVSKHVHYTTMIDFDDWFGRGQLPTASLQKLLYNGTLHWYDFYFYGLYMLHFVMPVLVGVLIWRLRPKAYWGYVASFVLLSYMGFLTYIIFPAAPPWMAAESHMIPAIEKLSTDIWWAFGVHNFPTLYAKFSPNPVAAVPSLHAAYPTLIFLFIWKLFGKKWGIPAFIYPASVWLGVVYMGEHYVFDVLIGILYASVAFLTVPRIGRLWRRWRKRGEASSPVAA